MEKPNPYTLPNGLTIAENALLVKVNRLFAGCLQMVPNKKNVAAAATLRDKKLAHVRMRQYRGAVLIEIRPLQYRPWEEINCWWVMGK